LQSTVYVLSSDGKTLYDVQALRAETTLNLYCTCQAGSKGQMCKHRVGLIEGNLQSVAPKTDAESLDMMLTWIRASEYPALVASLRAAEAAEKKAKIDIASIKKKIESMMKG
jgi:uncharacterized Zn finger protein